MRTRSESVLPPGGSILPREAVVLRREGAVLPREEAALSPEEAADFVVDAIIHRAPRVVTRLGLFARFMELFTPKMADVINATSFQMFPDSAAALGGNAKEQPPSKDAIVFAKLMKGLHL